MEDSAQSDCISALKASALGVSFISWLMAEAEIFSKALCSEIG